MGNDNEERTSLSSESEVENGGRRRGKSRDENKGQNAHAGMRRRRSSVQEPSDDSSEERSAAQSEHKKRSEKQNKKGKPHGERKKKTRKRLKKSERGSSGPADEHALEERMAASKKEPSKKSHTVRVSIVTEVTILDEEHPGIELSYDNNEAGDKSESRKLVVAHLDPVRFADYDVAIGDRIVYIGGTGTTNQPDLDSAMELIHRGPRPLNIGLERLIEKRSNVRPPVRVAPAISKHKGVWGTDGTAEVGKEDAFPDLGGDDKGYSNNSQRRCQFVHLRSKDLIDNSVSKVPPIPFSNSWEWLMRVTDYPEVSDARKVWVSDPQHGFVLGSLEECFRTSLRVTIVETGESKVLSIGKVLPFNAAQHIGTMPPYSKLGTLALLNPASVLDSLRRGFLDVNKKKLYAWMTENTLVALNPCVEAEGAFSIPLAEQPEPHLFHIADKAFKKATDPTLLRSQTIILNGISGSGKSKNARELALYLLETKPQAGISLQKLRAKLVACGILLQAFGNASTVRCGDSTCFSKLIRMHVRDGKIWNLSFEKHNLNLERLVRHSRYERNFHIFHQIANGWKTVQCTKDIQLSDPAEYAMLGTDSVLYRKVTRPHDTKSSKFPLTNSDALKRTLQALEVIGMDEDVREDILRMLVALIFLGNVKFTHNEQWNASGDMLAGQASSTSVNGPPAKTVLEDAVSERCFHQACTLLEIPPEFLLKWFCFKKRATWAKRQSPLPLGVKRATAMRDFFTKYLYSLIIDLVLQTMNGLFVDPGQHTGEGKSQVINILELPGFNFSLAPKVTLSPEASDKTSSEAGSETERASSSPTSDQGRTAQKSTESKSKGGSLHSSTHKIALISGGMQATSELLPNKFAESQLLSLEALFENYTNEVFEQQFQQAVVCSELGRIETIVTASSQPEDKTREVSETFTSLKKSLIRGSGKIMELLVGYPSGILSIMDQQSLLRGTRPHKDAEFVMQLNHLHEGNKLYQRAMFGYQSFKVKHFGGELLEYDAEGIVSQNARTISCGNQFSELFDTSKSPVLALLSSVAKQHRQAEEYEEQKLNQRVEVQTLAQRRRREVATLSEIVESSDLSFVKCILPSNDSTPNSWHGAGVLKQLSYLGVNQACAVRDALFPIKYTESEFIAKFGPVARPMLLPGSTPTARAFLTVLLGGEADCMLWQTCANLADDEEPCFLLTQRSHRVLEKTRWNLREKSVIKIQHAMMKYVERINAALIIQHFVYKTILDPNYLRQAALRILNAFRMFYVRNDFLIVRRATIRIQSVVRRFLCNNWDRRLFHMVVRVQKVWRGQIVRRRAKLLHLCQLSSLANVKIDSSHKDAVVTRSSLVLQTSSESLVGRQTRKKRLLVLTAGSRPEAALFDLVSSSKKQLWRFPCEPPTSQEDTLVGCFFSIEATVEGEKKKVSFCDLLEAEDNINWTADMKKPPSPHEIISLKTPFSKFVDRFFSAFVLTGNMTMLAEGKERGSWKDRFFVLHRCKLFCFKNEQIVQVMPLDGRTELRALNTYNSVEHNFIEVIPEEDDEKKVILRLQSREERDKLVQGLSWTTSLCRSLESLDLIRSHRPRSGTIATMALAITRIRSSGNFSRINRPPSLSPQSRRRSDPIQKSLAGFLSTMDLGAEDGSSTASATINSGSRHGQGGRRRASAKLDDLLRSGTHHSTGAGEDLADGSLDTTGEAPSGITGSVAELHNKLIVRNSESSAAILGRVKAEVLNARISKGLYHLMSSKEYLAEHAPRTELQPVSSDKRYKTMSLVKLSVGKADEAVEWFLRGAGFSDRILGTYESGKFDDGAELNSLLVFSDIELPSSRRSRRRRFLPSFASSSTSDDGVDGDSFEYDKDGKLFSTLLNRINLSQYLPAFEKEGLRSIRQAKSLSHDDLLESFNVESFSHRERLLDAFQNYGKTGSSLVQPKRNSLRVSQLFNEVSVLEDLFSRHGLSQLLSTFVDHNCTNLKEIKGLSSKHFKKMGISDADKKKIQDAVSELLRRTSSSTTEKLTDEVSGSSPVDSGASPDSSSESEEGESNPPSPLSVTQQHQQTTSSSSSNPSNAASSTGASGSANSSAVSGSTPLGIQQQGADQGGAEQVEGAQKKLSTRRSTIKFADQVDWTCKACSRRNVSDDLKCKICGSLRPSAKKTLEKVCTLDACIPWKCPVCLVMNPFSTYFCSWCNSTKSPECLYESEFSIGDKVRLIVSDVYQVPKGSSGIVIDVNPDKAVCQVTFDDGIVLRVCNDDMAKYERMTPLGRLNALLNRLSPTARFAAAFQSHH